MDKTFQITLFSSVIPDHAVSEEDVADLFIRFMFELESRFGMGALDVSVKEISDRYRPAEQE